jgi:uncharacterized surface protein with fasciclin (FAS1) repeats
MITKNIYTKVLGLAIATLTFTACSDAWDDHYENMGNATSGLHDGSLWQAINSNENLSNFASVLKECGYMPSLDGSQVFTVFAPTNDQFTKAEADALIASYKEQVQNNVTQENNTVIKEFIQNHIALYNYSVSDLRVDSIVLMNGKYAVLSDSTINGVPMLQKNQLYQNGVLYTLGKQVAYLPNVFEYVSKDADLDSLRSFLYNSHYYYLKFEPNQSVAGSIVNGKTQYLDSVFTQKNELYEYLGKINSEDSTYWMVAPTNEVWETLIAEYEPYFNYAPEVADRDSMVYTNSRLAIIEGTTFTRTYLNTEQNENDSVMSNQCVKDKTLTYVQRKSKWGLPFAYDQYYEPFKTNGIFDQTETIPCSNGQLMKASKWNIDKLNTFDKFVVATNKIKEVSKIKNPNSTNNEDSVETVKQNLKYVTSDNKYYNMLWGNSYIEFSQQYTTVNHSVTYILENVLSNIGYDIYLVAAPALAGDSTASDVDRLPTEVRCTLFNPGTGSEQLLGADGKTKTFVPTADRVDYLLLAEDYKFNYSTVGVSAEDLQVQLKVETRVGSADIRNNIKTRVMRINCILLVPHGMLELVDALPEKVGTLSNAKIGAVSANSVGKPGVIVYPHGKFDDRNYPAWYMQR